jgi:hypothetical protein
MIQYNERLIHMKFIFEHACDSNAELLAEIFTYFFGEIK